jgi:hypothetical protein
MCVQKVQLYLTNKKAVGAEGWPFKETVLQRGHRIVVASIWNETPVSLRFLMCCRASKRILISEQNVCLKVVLSSVSLKVWYFSTPLAKMWLKVHCSLRLHFHNYRRFHETFWEVNINCERAASVHSFCRIEVAVGLKVTRCLLLLWRLCVCVCLITTQEKTARNRS